MKYFLVILTEKLTYLKKKPASNGNRPKKM